MDDRPLGSERRPRPRSRDLWVAIAGTAGPQDATAVVQSGYAGLAAVAVLGVVFAISDKLGLASTLLGLGLVLVPVLLYVQLSRCLE